MAPRKKTKLSNDDEADAHDNNSVSKTPKKTRRSRKGCLENVQELPLDVSLQIFGFLHPKDLLNLARTSKAFRSFFLNRASSISIWKTSLRGVEGLPEKPEFISEPALAHFLFNSVCQHCGKFTTRRPIWPWFARYCVECTLTMSCRLREFSHADKDLMSVVQGNAFTLFEIYFAPGRHGGCHIHSPKLDNFVREWENIVKDDEDGRKALIERQSRAKKEDSVVWQRFQAWHMVEMRQRSAELGGIKDQRLQEIMDRLQREDSEWLPEMVHFEPRFVRYFIKCVPAVRQPSRLTERAWPKVLAALQGQMTALRARRLQQEQEKQAMLAEADPEDDVLGNTLMYH
ncbi:hypothetical protein V8D89_011845 [Ganoderma adspersum]